jgi:hypothetical protein
MAIAKTPSPRLLEVSNLQGISSPLCLFVGAVGCGVQDSIDTIFKLIYRTHA